MIMVVFVSLKIIFYHVVYLKSHAITVILLQRNRNDTLGGFSIKYLKIILFFNLYVFISGRYCE